MCAKENDGDRRIILSPELVLWGYTQGMFPMGDQETGEIQWFSPDPRAIIDLTGLKISRSLRQVIRSGKFSVTVDRCFGRIMRACADRDETWITPEIISIYESIHRMGNAHSIEVWLGDELVGGLYGVAMGGAFFGESMFHTARDASKVALAGLVQRMTDRQFVLLDTQYLTEHLQGLGAYLIPRDDYLKRLKRAITLEVGLTDEGDDTIELQA